jgi:hypothetical protein
MPAPKNPLPSTPITSTLVTTIVIIAPPRSALRMVAKKKKKISGNR